MFVPSVVAIFLLHLCFICKSFVAELFVGNFKQSSGVLAARKSNGLLSLLFYKYHMPAHPPPLHRPSIPLEAAKR